MNATIRDFEVHLKTFLCKAIFVLRGGALLAKQRGFSLYDIEQFIREAGAEKVNEKAVVSLEKELEDTVKDLVNEASMYANYAGRKRLINLSDIELAKGHRKRTRLYIVRSSNFKKKALKKHVNARSKLVLKQ